VTFVASHLPIGSSVISNIEGRVRFGDTEHTFMLYLKDNTHGSSKQKVVWHQQSFYFKSKTESADLVIDNLNRNIGLLIDNVRIHKVIKDSNDVDAKRIHINIIAHPSSSGSLSLPWRKLKSSGCFTLILEYDLCSLLKTIYCDC
jgi:hypothetical protein